MSEFLSLKNIEKRFPTSGKEAYIALTDVNLDIKKNEIISIIGHKGCGKSTLLNIILGLEKQSKGEIILNGNAVSEPGPDRAVVFQHGSLLPWLSVYENIEMAIRKIMPKLDALTLRERVEKFVSMVNLDAAKDKLPCDISEGMNQRADIARALSIEPDVLLMDEPFAAIDSLTRTTLQELLMHIQQSVNTTMIIMTHDIDEAVLLSDRVVMMTNGPAATIGEILEVNLERPRNRVELQHDPEYIRCREAIVAFFYEKFAKEDE